MLEENSPWQNPWRTSRILAFAFNFCCCGFSLQTWWCNFIKTVIELWFPGNPWSWAARIPEIADIDYLSLWAKSAFLSKAIPIFLISLYHCFTDHCIRTITGTSTVITNLSAFNIYSLEGTKELQALVFLLMFLLNLIMKITMDFATVLLPRKLSFS